MLYSLIGGYWCFRVTCASIFMFEDEGNIFLWNIGNHLSDYMVLYNQEDHSMKSVIYLNKFIGNMQILTKQTILITPVLYCRFLF
jgi:hypothetical protein